MPNSCRPLFLITPAIDGVIARLTDGMKNVAGILCASNRFTTRGRPARAPYSACDSDPTVGSPKRIATVSLSTSNESSTATRAPFGQAFGCSDLPARTAFTTLLTESIVPVSYTHLTLPTSDLV